MLKALVAGTEDPEHSLALLRTDATKQAQLFRLCLKCDHHRFFQTIWRIWSFLMLTSNV